MIKSNITWHPSGLTREERNQLRAQEGFTIWFTGLSGSGKSTIATALEQHLLHHGLDAYRLDGMRFCLPDSRLMPVLYSSARAVIYNISAGVIVIFGCDCFSWSKGLFYIYWQRNMALGIAT